VFAGSAVAVERIFSGGHDTISLRRASIQPEMVRTLMLVKHCLQLKKNSNIISIDWLCLFNLKLTFCIPSLQPSIRPSRTCSSSGIWQYGYGSGISVTVLCPYLYGRTPYTVQCTALYTAHTISFLVFPLSSLLIHSRYTFLLFSYII